MDAIGINGGIIVAGGVAECECCGPVCDNGAPFLDVTLTWTDAATTKDYLGHTFTNGETIAMCPGGYTCFDGFTTTNSQPQQLEAWNKRAGQQKAYDIYRTVSYGTGSPNPPTTYFQTNIYNEEIGLKMDNRSGSGGTFQRIRRVVNRDGLLTHFYASSFGTSGFMRLYATVNNGGATLTPPWTTPTISHGIPDDFEGSITSGGGLTITWAKNHTGVPWGDCFT